MRQPAMFKIHIVNWMNRKAYQAHLERYFRIRHQIYIEERNWRQIERPIPFEIDAFDTEQTIYLIGIDDDGNIAGSSRLVPTTEPHLLSVVFPMLTEADPPKGPEIFEWTRFFVSPPLRISGKSSLAAGVVLCGLLEASLVLGVTQISVVCEAFWPKRLRKLGWSVQQLGPVLDHPDGCILALLINVSADALAATRAAYGLDEASVLANA